MDHSILGGGMPLDSHSADEQQASRSSSLVTTNKRKRESDTPEDEEDSFGDDKDPHNDLDGSTALCIPSDHSEEAGLHPYHISLRSVPAQRQDFEQDRGASTFDIDNIPPNYSFLQLRYPDSNGLTNKGRCDIIYGQRPVIPDPWTQAHSRWQTEMLFSSRKDSDRLAERSDERAMEEALEKFRPGFQDLVLPDQPKLRQAVGETAEWLKEDCVSRGRFISMCGDGTLKSASTSTHEVAGRPQLHKEEISAAEACVAMLQEITEKLVKSFDGRKPAQQFWETRETSLARVSAKRSKISCANARVLLEFKKDPVLDFRARSINPANRVVPAVIRHAVELVDNNPIAGRVTVASVTGTFIRLYFVDTYSFSTTRLFNFGDESHLYDVVKLVAFLTGPFQNVLESWQPDHLPFETRIPSRPAGSTDTSLKSVDPQSRDFVIGGARLSGSGESRNDQVSVQTSSRRWQWDSEAEKVWWMVRTFGRRTAIWAGRTSEVPVSGEPSKEPVETIVKAAWLPLELRAHEHEMLGRLHPTSLLPPGCRFAKLDDSSMAQIVKTIPKSIGLIELDTTVNDKTGSITNEIHARHGDPASASSHLELTVLAMHGPRDRPSILANIVWRQVGKRKIGFLIDYGNARYLDHKRSPGPYTLSAICEDDKRSGTQDFLSTAVLTTARTLPAYQGALISLKTVSSEDRQALKRAEERVAELKPILLKSRHRYIDDLESVLYALTFWAASISAKSQDALNLIRTTLAQPLLKELAWQTNLVQLIPQIGKSEGFPDLIESLAYTVRSARKLLEKDLEREEMSPYLTAIEDECFETFHHTLKEWIEARRP